MYARRSIAALLPLTGQIANRNLKYQIYFYLRPLPIRLVGYFFDIQNYRTIFRKKKQMTFNGTHNNYCSSSGPGVGHRGG